MKRYINTLIFLACAVAVFAQAPQKFNYQAVARNAQGAVLPNQNVKIQASILDGSANGTNLYSETHNVTTNQLGLFNLAIGDGTLLIGNFSNITWASGDKYLKIEMDATGGNNFSLVGASQLLSVPYAIYSEKSNIQAGSGISISNNVVQNTGDISNTNELQTLSLSGNTLTLSQSGGSVTLPNGGTSQWTTTGSNIFYNTGNVGINTNSPSEKLHLAGKMKIDGTNTLEFGAGVSGKQADAGKIGYQTFTTDALDILGAGSSGTNRKIKFWNEGGADFTGNIGTAGKSIAMTSATLPIGLSQELGTTTPLLHLDVNFRHPNKNTTYLGAAFRIDSRNNSGAPLFQWIYRPANSTTENIITTIDYLGNAVFTGNLTAAGLKVTTGAAAGKVLTSDASGNATWQTPSGGGSGQWTTVTGGIQYNTGKVLIGNVTTPGNYQLYVEQGILAERVKVALKSTSHWADYVFSPNYKLMPLTQVEEYITKNNHLPNVPSAEEVHKEGIDMATMDAKLLEKIEELTLYMIELKKENLALKERIGVLESQGSNNPQKK
jgi:hypothetical protein